MRRARGMTLVEILVAMSLLAILSAMGYKAFSALMLSREQLTAYSARWTDLARVFHRVETDVAALATAAEAGAVPPPTASQADTLTLEETADGAQRLVLPAYGNKSPLGRIERVYLADGKGLSWQSRPLGFAREAVPERYPLFGGDTHARFAVLLAGNRESPRWPVDGVPPGDARALVMTVTLQGGQTVRRVWSLP
ncbi:prepilin-type N-terminal cleavage/methylation domain-containing protein [Crenobacter caeni]|uniref:Prepilin-type N-terminal cleavage/methylation domain-containing protein n=1 Tax=Crenobacter caeni TaxID=2705474 RepID=A0A6B2KTC1_9NEIS|nr:prepilin-type N-terminal cleavage/methylation domain-containing protein [Crenobacter caeni]NDV13354.1 prepilin-type N-terminal cleavage/methylation domain-containing protein [Crenobacter caeni]